MLYLGTGGVAGAGPRRGSLGRAVRALGGQPAAAVRVAEALAVLFADLREQNGHSVQHVCQPATGPRLKSPEAPQFVLYVCSAWKKLGNLTFSTLGWDL